MISHENPSDCSRYTHCAGAGSLLRDVNCNGRTVHGTVPTGVSGRVEAQRLKLSTEARKWLSSESNTSGSFAMLLSVDITDMRRLTTRIRSEKCVVSRFRRCADAIECTYTNFDSIAYTHVGYMVYPIAPRLQTCTACYCTEYCRQC